MLDYRLDLATLVFSFMISFIKIIVLEFFYDCLIVGDHNNDKEGYFDIH